MYIRGKKATLLFLKDGEYTAFRCTTDCSLSINTETVQVRTIGDGVWAKPRGQRQSYTLSLTGLIELQAIYPVTFWLIENFVMQMLPVPYRLIFEDPASGLLKLITGEAIIKTATTTGVPVGFATGAFEMEGVGAPVITDSATSCNATIGTIEIGPGNEDIGAVASVSYSEVVNATRLEYSVDGGAREVIFDPGSTGIFYLFDLADGPHTLEVWAVCFSGVDGENNELSFEISSGEPGPTCAAPGTITFEDVTDTSFTATWVEPGPPPTDGYEWLLLNYATMAEVQFGTTVGNTQMFAGMDTGVEYQFRVRSVCTEGVSLSGYTSALITLTGAACNVPGSPVMSAITSTTATATWTAPTPAPGSGYEWEVLNGVTVINSGTTALLSVNLSGLPSGTLLTFQVKSICGVGSESGFNSTGFTTDSVSNNIDWALNEDLGNGTLVIRVNGVDVVNATTAGAGNFMAAAGDAIQVRLTASTGNNTVDDLTASVQIVNDTDSGLTVSSFVTTSGHNYSITAEVTS